MRRARWRLSGLLILIAGLALLSAGAIKWRRYTQLREQIAIYSRDEKSLMDAYHEGSQLTSMCGNQRRMLAAYLAVAAERRRCIEDCKRAIKRIW